MTLKIWPSDNTEPVWRMSSTSTRGSAVSIARLVRRHTFSSYNVRCNQTWEERVPLYINTCSIHLECHHWSTSCIPRVIHQESSASCNQDFKGFPLKKKKKRASQAHNLSCSPNDFWIFAGLERMHYGQRLKKSMKELFRPSNRMWHSQSIIIRQILNPK